MKIVSIEKLVVLIIIMLIIYSTLSIGFYRQWLKPQNEKIGYILAYDYVRNSPTFKFDGIEGTLKHVKTLEQCPYCHLEGIKTLTYVFTFDSKYAGYGDRTGQLVPDMRTSHTASVTVYKNEVILAILDGIWDMINQITILQE